MITKEALIGVFFALFLKPCPVGEKRLYGVDKGCGYAIIEDGRVLNVLKTRLA